MGCRDCAIRTANSIASISAPGASSSTAAIRAPQRYHHPLEPINADSRTDGADAFSAAFTRGVYGGGVRNVVKSLGIQHAFFHPLRKL